jgi:act minimal PKS acyl carrier protein
MAVFTLDELRVLLRQCAGVDESVDLDGDISEISFDDLGYDSLALLNTTSRIERSYAIGLPDQVIEECTSPQLLLDAVNKALAGTPVAAS